MAKTAGIVIDKERQEVFVNKNRLRLPPRQYRLLVSLIDQPKTHSRAALMKMISKPGERREVDERTVDQHVSRLRRALEKAGLKAVVIETVPDHGYKYNAI